MEQSDDGSVRTAAVGTVEGFARRDMRNENSGRISETVQRVPKGNSDQPL